MSSVELKTATNLFLPSVSEMVPVGNHLVYTDLKTLKHLELNIMEPVAWSHFMSLVAASNCVSSEDIYLIRRGITGFEWVYNVKVKGGGGYRDVMSAVDVATQHSMREIGNRALQLEKKMFMRERLLNKLLNRELTISQQVQDIESSKPVKSKKKKKSVRDLSVQELAKVSLESVQPEMPCKPDNKEDDESAVSPVGPNGNSGANSSDGENAASMTVFVVDLFGKLLSIECDPSDLVMDLLDMVENEMEVWGADSYMQYGIIKLDDPNRTLESYGIGEFSTVRLNGRLRGGAVIKTITKKEKAVKATKEVRISSISEELVQLHQQIHQLRSFEVDAVGIIRAAVEECSKVMAMDNKTAFSQLAGIASTDSLTTAINSLDSTNDETARLNAVTAALFSPVLVPVVALKGRLEQEERGIHNVCECAGLNVCFVSTCFQLLP